MRVLNFVWLWDKSTLSEEDARNVEMWKRLNSDFHVKLWHGDEITKFISIHYPWAKAGWDEIVAMWKLDGKTHHLARLSDLARCLILHHDHAAEIALTHGHYGPDEPATEWAMYADVDTTPLRAVSDFLEDAALLGEEVRRVKSVPQKVSRRTIDYSKLDLLFSGENFQVRNGPGKVQVSNCVILARPGHPFFETFVQKGLRSKHTSVLRTYGTWALSDELARQAPYIRSRVIPFHYFNYSVELPMPPPPWCVCIHRNFISWGDPSKSSPWLA